MEKKKILDKELTNLKKEEKRLTSELGHLTNNINTNFKKHNYFEELYQTKQLMLQNEKEKFFAKTNSLEYLNLDCDSNVEDNKNSLGFQPKINETSTPNVTIDNSDLNYQNYNQE